jgi:hypothetical protein
MWKDDDPEVFNTFSNKTIVELGIDDGIKNGAEVSESIIETEFEFWTKKMHRNITQLDNEKITFTNKFYEIHAQASMNNVDVTDWATDANIQFRVGMHNTRSQRDYSIVNVKYPGKGVATTAASFECLDAFH